MDDFKEQQLQELEALESMYANELAILCRDYPSISLEIEIRPESTEFEREFGREVAKFHATLPAEYPNVGPQIDLTSLEIVEVDEEEEENGDKDGRRDDGVAEEQQRLLVAKVREELEKAVEDSLGMPMLFTLINTFQESLVQVCTEHADSVAETARKKAEQVEKEEMVRFEGTRVTVESFNKWNQEFMEELRLKKEKENKGAITSNRLTGKQMFLADKSLNISDLKLLNAPDMEEEDVAPGNRVQIDHALFEDDLDISDEDTSDDEYQPDMSDDE